MNHACFAAATFIIGAGAIEPSPGQQAPPLYQIKAEGPSENFGFHSDSAGDVDGDGVADVIVSGTGPIRVYSGATFQLILEIPETYLPGNGLGAPVSGLGDVDQDGYGDVVVGLQLDDWGPDQEAGGVKVFSGVDGAEIYYLHGSSQPAQLGTDVDGVGDVDGDGVPDFIAGAPIDDLDETVTGTARVYSGATGAEIWVLTGLYGWLSSEEFGSRVSAAGDLDLDGRCDVLAAPQDPLLSYVLAFDGASGDLMCTVVGPYFDSGFGKGIEVLGDVDGDGVNDVVIGSSGGPIPSNLTGAVHVFSGASIGSGTSPAPLYSFVGDAPIDYLGGRVSGGGDFDGDGVPDILASGWQCFGTGSCIGNPGYVRGWSGADGSILFTVYGSSTAQDGFGASCAILGDINGDGRAEYGVGAPQAVTAGLFSGRYDIHAASSPDLLVTDVELSLAAGGLQELRLKPGSAYAGAPYLLLGTASNIWPGTAVDGLTVPLNVDAYTLLTLGSPNVPPLNGSFGLLGPGGKATAQFAFPGGADPTLAGIALHHAYVLFSPSFSIELASNAAPLVLVP